MQHAARFSPHHSQQLCRWYARSGTCRTKGCKLSHVKAADTGVAAQASYDDRLWTLSSTEVRYHLLFSVLCCCCAWLHSTLQLSTVQIIVSNESKTFRRVASSNMLLLRCCADILQLLLRACTCAVQDDKSQPGQQSWRFSVASYNILADKYVSSRHLSYINHMRHSHGAAKQLRSSNAKHVLPTAT